MKLSIDKKNGMTIYNVKFDNLADLYYYLKSNPRVNKINVGFTNTLFDIDGKYIVNKEKTKDRKEYIQDLIKDLWEE